MTSFNQNVDDILFFQKIIKFRWMRGRWADGDWCVFALIFRKKFRTLGAAHRGRWLMAVKIVEMSCGGHWKCAANIFFLPFYLWKEAVECHSLIPLRLSIIDRRFGATLFVPRDPTPSSGRNVKRSHFCYFRDPTVTSLATLGRFLSFVHRKPEGMGSLTSLRRVPSSD